MLSWEFVTYEVSISKKAARGCVRSRSRFCEDNGRESLANCLIFAISLGKEKMVTPHLNPLPAAGERRITAGILTEKFEQGA